MATVTASIKKDSAGELILGLLHAVTNAHILHLQTESYAKHVALGEFYEGLGDLVDDFAEAYAGIFSPFKSNMPVYRLPESDEVTFVTNVKQFVDQTRQSVGFPQQSELQNIVDEIAALCDKTLYKLRFLS